MMPTTSEEEFEKELENQEELLQLARHKMNSLRKQLLDAEADLLDCNLQIERLKESLRKFRGMYPNLCKPREL